MEERDGEEVEEMDSERDQASGEAPRRRPSGWRFDERGEDQRGLGEGSGLPSGTQRTSGRGQALPEQTPPTGNEAAKNQEEVKPDKQEEIRARWEAVLASTSAANRLARVEMLAGQVEALAARLDEVLESASTPRDLRAASDVARTIGGLIREIRSEVGDYDPASVALVEQHDPIAELLRELRAVRIREAKKDARRASAKRD